MSASLLALIASTSSPSSAVLSSPAAASISAFVELSTLSPMSRSDFSVLYSRFSALFLTSAVSRALRSSSACDSASFIIRSMSCSLRPLEAVMVIFCSLPVPRSLALTCTMPLASMSKVTSICGMPRGAGGMPTSWNLPSVLL